MGNGTKILVFADDLTGAAEIGSVSLRFGLSARILPDDPQADKFSEDVIIVDTNSRNLPPQAALKKLESLTQHLSKNSFALVYKKIDSILRGPVLHELVGITRGLGFSSIVTVPANPSKGRIIVDGNYIINGIPLSQTEFRYDPDYPCLKSSVHELLFNSKKERIEEVLGIDSIRANLSIPDVSTTEDIDVIASTVKLNECLVAGGSDFFASLLSSTLKLRAVVPEAAPLNNRGHCFIIGSQAASSRKTKELLSDSGFSCFSVCNPIDKTGLEKLKDSIFTKASSGENLLVTLPLEIINDKNLAEMYYSELISLAGEVIKMARGKYRFYIEGGRTASDVCRHTGCSSLVVITSYKSGAAMLFDEKNNAEILVKPGSYDWPEENFKLAGP
jgi:uncharacterized protein YgbK (DUF1537 family)